MSPFRPALASLVALTLVGSALAGPEAALRGKQDSEIMILADADLAGGMEDPVFGQEPATTQPEVLPEAAVSEPEPGQNPAKIQPETPPAREGLLTWQGRNSW